MAQTYHAVRAEHHQQRGAVAVGQAHSDHEAIHPHIRDENLRVQAQDEERDPDDASRVHPCHSFLVENNERVPPGRTHTRYAELLACMKMQRDSDVPWKCSAREVTRVEESDEDDLHVQGHD